jgi:hypothetical protein
VVRVSHLGKRFSACDGGQDEREGDRSKQGWDSIWSEGRPIGKNRWPEQSTMVVLAIASGVPITIPFREA